MHDIWHQMLGTDTRIVPMTKLPCKELGTRHHYLPCLANTYNKHVTQCDQTLMRPAHNNVEHKSSKQNPLNTPRLS